MEKVTIGNAELWHGDCRELLATTVADCVITDPPYGIALQENGRNGYNWKIEGDENTEAGMTVIYWAEQTGIPIAAFASPRKPWPGAWRGFLVWDKGGAVGGGGDIKTCWKQTWELIQVARNKPLNGGRDESVLRYPIGQRDLHYHPTQKPQHLMQYLVYKMTGENDVVFDPFMGSGSTGVAAMCTQRRFIGCEVERRFFDIACERIDAAQAQGRLAI